MAALYDNATLGENTNALTLTFAHTCSGANRFLLVGVSCYDDFGNTTSGVTYNGVAMTNIDATLFNATNTNEASLWGLINPASGANNVVVTCTQNINAATEIHAGAVSFTSVHQTTAWGTPSKVATDNVQVSSLTITDAVAGDLVLEIFSIYNTTPTIGAGQTARISQDNGSALDSIYMSEEAGAASVTMSWTWGVNRSPGHIAVSIFQAPSGNQTATPNTLALVLTTYAPNVTIPGPSYIMLRGTR